MNNNNNKRKGKFLILFKKEIKDLITVQTLIPILLMFAIFYFMGNLMTSMMGGGDTITVVTEQTDQSGQTYETEMTFSANAMIGFIDNDNSELSNYIKDNLNKAGILLVPVNSTEPDKALDELANYNYNGEEVKIQTLLIINKGFGEKLRSGNNQFVAIDAYSAVDSFGLTSMVSGASAQTAIYAINGILSEKLYEIYGGDTEININYIKNPVYSNDYTYINDSTENVSATEVLGYVSAQTMIIPMAIFYIIMMSTQMLAASIVNEKTDKTLETIMTTPLSRMSVLVAKILASAIYAILYAIAYIIGYKRLMDGITGGGTYTQEFVSALEKFGITFNVTAFAVIGVQLFLSVLCGLAISMLIGMMIEDMKSLQAYLMPVIFITMIPFFLSMFLDINTLPTIIKIIIYILPFTHTYTAATNLFMQNYTLIAAGIIYQAIFVAVLLTFAVRIFNSDKLFTLGQIMKKKPLKKNNSLLGKLFTKK